MLTHARLIADLVILDMPAGGGPLFEKLIRSGGVDEVLLVTTDAPTSVRAAEKCGMLLSDIGIKKTSLIINGYHVDKPKQNSAGLWSMLESVSLPAAGVIPYDPVVGLSLRMGKPVTAMNRSPAGLAVENIFMRLAGETVPLLDGVISKRKRKKLFTV